MRPCVSLLALPVALAAAADNVQYARQFSRDNGDLVARTDLSPQEVCGDNYVDCNNGWCCAAGTTCDGTFDTIPICKDPTHTLDDLPFMDGTAVASPYKNVESVIASMTALEQSIIDNPTASAVFSGPDGTATGGSTAPLTAKPTATTTPSAQTGAAAMAKPAGFGTAFSSVISIWAVGVIGGAGWFLVR